MKVPMKVPMKKPMKTSTESPVKALMKAPKAARAHSQKGMTMITLVLALALFTSILLIIVKIAPLYANNMALKNSIKSTIANNNVAEMSLVRFRNEAMTNIIINGIRDLPESAIEYTSEGSFRYIDVNYEKRIDIFYNIDVIVTFENRFNRY